MKNETYEVNAVLNVESSQLDEALEKVEKLEKALNKANLAMNKLTGTKSENIIVGTRLND